MPGLLGTVGSVAHARAVNQMCSLLRHRGEEITILPHTADVVLASVHDADAPGLAVDQDRVLVCDAAIYALSDDRADFLEIKRPVSLPADVLLQLDRAFSLRAVEQIDGDHAYVIVDSERREITFACDWLGSRPLFWTRLEGGGIAFASEYKALLAFPDVAAEADHDMVQFLQCSKQLPPGRTLLTRVQECLPGVAQRIDFSGSAIARHTLPKCRVGAVIGTPDDAAGLILTSLKGAIRRRSSGLERIGLALSGGIDSIGLAFLLRQTHPDKEIHTYTAGHGPEDPEMVRAEQVAARIGARHHAVVTSPDLLGKLLREVVRHLEDPVARSDTLQLYCLAMEARNAVKVVFTAHGADGLFAGMPRHRLLHLASRLPALQGYLKELYDLTQYGIEPSTLPGWMLCRLWDRGKVPTVPEVRNARWPDRPQLPRMQPEYVNQVMANGFAAGMAQSLRKYERMFAAFGLEHRSPFCDRALAEAAFTVSDRLKIRGRTNKYILRKALAGIVPDEFRKVPKYAQRMKYDLAFSDCLDELARDLLAPERVDRRRLFEPPSIAALFRRETGVAYAPEAAMRLWTAALTECWAQIFLDGHDNTALRDGGCRS